MKKLFAVGLIATLFAISVAAFADDHPTQPIKGTEGPDDGHGYAAVHLEKGF